MKIVLLFMAAFSFGWCTAYIFRKIESYYFKKQLLELYEREEEWERRKSGIYSRIYRENGE